MAASDIAVDGARREATTAVAAIDPIHAGERAAQALAGVPERLRIRARAAIRDWLPDQHRAFFAALPFLPVAALDAEGWPAATVLTGPPGFIASPDPRTLRIAAAPAPDDPAGAALLPGAAIGMLGIDLATRRRNRANGRITARDAAGLTVAVAQSFGNCPQYIQARDPRPAPAAAAAPQRLDRLDAAARATVAGADTCFVASASGPRDDPALAVDMSHRGGRAGFVRVDGDVLTIPDFAGNRYFNTLGNLLAYPRAGLLFIDFATGDLLHLAGAAEILWEVPPAERLPGAERLWRVRVARGWRRAGALPLRWDFRGPVPSTERTGRWAQPS